MSGCLRIAWGAMNRVLIKTVVALSLSVGVGFSQKNNQFSYDCVTEVVTNQEQGFRLPLVTEKVAQKVYNHLNQSILFDTKFVSKPYLVREYNLLQRPFVAGCNGFTFSTIAEDDFEVSGTLFDRGSDTLLVIGGGFTNERELMAPFLAMFPHYDIVLFDYRGHGFRQFNVWDTKSWPLSFSKWMIGCRLRDTLLGQEEHNEVFAAIDYAKSRKPYKRIFGLGVCFSAFIFLKAASLRKNLFDKLVLDGCWLSLPLFIQKIKADPRLVFDPQHGGCAHDSYFKKPRVQDALFWILSSVFGLELHDISLLDFLPNLNPNLSLLFFYGKNDLVVARNEFETLWDAAHVYEKTALVTSNPHVRNHWKQKELYAQACNLFFEETHKRFIELLREPDRLIDYHKTQFDFLVNQCIKNRGTTIVSTSSRT